LGVRILVVDDFAKWRHHATAALRQEPDLQIVAEAADGITAVEKAKELQPDLILLDIGLPDLNGMEVARQIRDCCPQSKILIVSEQHLSEIAEEAFHAGAYGYVVKSHAGRELLAAVKTVLQGKRFVSVSLKERMRSALPHLTLVDSPE